MYKIKNLSKIKIKNPILIEGLPGIGNVGKVAVDFIIDKSKAKRIIEISSHSFPHAVFVNEENIIELPTIEIYHKKLNNKDILLLAGDVQPIDEHSCYEFCDAVLDFFQGCKGKEIITIGGVGLQRIPKKPKVYFTANNKKTLNKYRINSTDSLFGTVGPIIGVSGLLIGLAKKRNIPAVSLLAETLAHPTYLGIKGAREVLDILNKKLNLSLDINTLDSEIESMEDELKNKTGIIKKINKPQKEINYPKLDYIG